MTYRPKPASFGLVVTKGPRGVLLRAGQTIVGDPSPYSHAFLVLDNDEVIEATDGGAVLTPLAKFMGRTDVVFCDRPIQDYMAGEHLAGNGFRPHGRAAVEAIRRDYVVGIAREMVGTPYNWGTYLVLALVAGGIDPKWLRKRVADSGRMICSQLVDEAYLRAGIHLFDDGRWPGEVTPGDLDEYHRRVA